MDKDKKSDNKKLNNMACPIGKSQAHLRRSLSKIPSTDTPHFFDMYRGYFPLWRKIVDWGWYKDSNTKAVFLHLLLTANHKDTDFLGHKIKEGQCVHGLIELSKNLGLSLQSTRTALKHLKSTNELTVKATNRFTVYSLTNYFKYLPENSANNKPLNKQLTNHQQTTNKQLTTSNNVKNVKNVKNIKETGSPINFSDKETHIRKHIGDTPPINRFKKPTIKEIQEYVRAKKMHVDVDTFFDYYESNGWKVGRTPMRNWQATVRNWYRRENPSKEELDDKL